IIIGMIVAEIVEQQERIELVRIAEAEGATQLHPCAFHRGCGFNGSLHWPNRHDEPLSAVSRFRLSSSHLWERQAACKGRELIDKGIEKSLVLLSGTFPFELKYSGFYDMESFAPMAANPLPP